MSNKCSNCGFDANHKLIENIEFVNKRLEEIDQEPVSADVIDIAMELNLTDRQIRKYISLLEKYGQQDLIARIKNGESLNSLDKKRKKKKIGLVKAHKILENDYELDYKGFRELLKPYKKRNYEEE